MATIVDCNAEDGSVIYVNLDNVNSFSSRGDKGGTLFRFAAGDSLAVTTPIEHFLGIEHFSASAKGSAKLSASQCAIAHSVVE